MKTAPTCLAVLSLVAFVAATNAQEGPKPGPEHEKLKQMAGEWEAKTKLHIPGVPATESAGEYKAAMDVGGLFLVGQFKGEMLGQTFIGRGLTGYDTFKKKNTGVWVDSMSTAIYTTEGSWDASGKVLTEHMEGPDPATGKTMKMRTVLEIADKDRMTMKMYGPDPEGKEFLMMEIVYTRKK